VYFFLISKQLVTEGFTNIYLFYQFINKIFLIVLIVHHL
jgi:hypothetical protein